MEAIFHEYRMLGRPANHEIHYFLPIVGNAAADGDIDRFRTSRRALGHGRLACIVVDRAFGSRRGHDPFCLQAADKGQLVFIFNL